MRKNIDKKYKKCPKKSKNGFPELDSDMKYSLNSARQPLPHEIQEKQKHLRRSCADDRYQVNKNIFGICVPSGR